MEITNFKYKDALLSVIGSLGNDNVEVVYDNGNIVIIRVKTFKACEYLFKDCSYWCIAKRIEHWNNYVNNVSTFQYFLINTDSVDSDEFEARNNSMIGFTVNLGDRKFVTAAHAKNDGELNASSPKNRSYTEFELLCKDFGVYDFIFKEKRKKSFIVKFLAWFLKEEEEKENMGVSPYRESK